MGRGLFVTFEGPEGSGKTTQIKKLTEFLKKKKKKHLVLREPGGTKISEAIRKILLDSKFSEMDQHTELLLYLAARAQLVHQRIMPALEEGKIVICDRFEDSTVAYQGYGRGISLSAINQASRLARESLKPDVTFLMNLPPRDGFKRVGRRDRMEKQSLAFHKKVYKGFLALARKNKKRFHIIDAKQSKSKVSEKILRVINDVL